MPFSSLASIFFWKVAKSTVGTAVHSMPSVFLIELQTASDQALFGESAL